MTHFLSLRGLQTFWSDAKSVFQDKLVSGTNIKTINNQSILGSGDIQVGGSGTPVWGNIQGTLSNQTDLNTALTSKATNSAVVHNTGNENIGGTKTFTTGVNIEASGGTETLINFQDMMGDDIGKLGVNTSSKPIFKVGSTTSEIITTSNKDTSPTSGSTNYVTSGGIYTAVSSKANDSAVVHNTGNETIAGTKTFSSPIYYAGGHMLNGDSTGAWFGSNAHGFFNTYSSGPTWMDSGGDEYDIPTAKDKVTTISSSATHAQYPSAKAVYDYIQSLDGNGVEY